MNAKGTNQVTFLAISGLKFPEQSRKYLMDLVAEVAVANKVSFIVAAGHVIAGRELEAQLKNELTGVKDLKQREVTEAELIEDMSFSFDEFLPVIKGVNYHIVIAEKVYDRPIGKKILNNVFNLRGRSRGDIRLYDDPESKIPILIPGFGDMRVLVPQKQLWHYESKTGPIQRLVNSFRSRTSSYPMPKLILGGCTGVSTFFPYYGGYVVAVPALRKIDEQQSAEDSVGCTLITIIREEIDGEEHFRIIWKGINLKGLVSQERELSMPKNVSKDEERVLKSLTSSGGSLRTILFNINYRNHLRKPWTVEHLKPVVEELKKRRLITYSERGNFYRMSKDLVEQMHVSLTDFLKDSKTLTTVDKSCWHVGCLKTLYYTVLRDEPLLAVDADAIVANGDLTQGISHNYEYNGELLTGLMNGNDKEEIVCGLMQADIIVTCFAMRWDKYSQDKLSDMDFVRKCLVQYVYKYGNHDEGRFSHGKKAINLSEFDRTVRETVFLKLLEFLARKRVTVDALALRKLVDEKIVRVGETHVSMINGIPVGLKHPSMSRTKTKGNRPQEAAGFFEHSLQSRPELYMRNVVTVRVANFHEAAALFVSVFGKTLFCLMTGAQVYETEFENSKNKIVDHGLAKTVVEIGPKDELLSAQVEFHTQIDKRDRRIVLADNPTAKDVLSLQLRLAAKYNILWR